MDAAAFGGGRRNAEDDGVCVRHRSGRGTAAGSGEAVAAPELSFRAHMLVDQTYLSTQIYLTVAVLYLAMSLPLARLVHSLERRMARGRVA